jgi:phenylalanyl-tRNA synthetase alpha chain
MQNNLDKIEKQFQNEIAMAGNDAAIEEMRIRYLGKKGRLEEVLITLGSLSSERRKVVGTAANHLKQVIEQTLASRQKELSNRI